MTNPLTIIRPDRIERYEVVRDTRIGGQGNDLPLLPTQHRHRWRSLVPVAPYVGGQAVRAIRVRAGDG